MNKSPSFISYLRPSLLGDVIASLPVAIYLEKKYPNSYKCAYIDQKCYQIAPFLLNQPNIDAIRISDESDKFNHNDKIFFNQFEYQFEPYAAPTDLEYFNNYHFCEEIFRMTQCRNGGGRVDPKEYNVLTDEEKKPRLHCWFKPERHPKTIALWSKVGYNNNDPSINQRSPSNEFWSEVCHDLILDGYKIALLGFSDFKVKNPAVQDLSMLSLFDSIKFALGCDINICLDSGSGWLLGAYGVNQILLYTNYKKNHFQNFDAICPINYRGNCQYLYGENGINNIECNKVLEMINKFK